MGLVHKQQKILREIIQQGIRAAALSSAGQHPGIVFDALAEADFGEHLHVVIGAFHDALRLDELVVCLEVSYPLLHLLPNLAQRLLHLIPRNDIMGRRIDCHMGDNILHLSGDGIDFGDAVNLVPEKFHPNRRLAAVGRENLHHVAPHPELVSGEIDVVALVLQIHQLSGQLVPLLLHPGPQGNHHVAVVDWVAQRIDAGHACHDDDIPSLRKRRGCRVSQLFDFIVDGAVLLDIGIGVGDVGLRLIIVIVGHKIFHRIVWEKGFELRTQLGCQRLVVRQHQRGTIDLLDNVCHREGFAGAGNTQQRLFPVSRQHPLCQTLDCLRLVACRLIGGYQLKSSCLFHKKQLPSFFPLPA